MLLHGTLTSSSTQYVPDVSFRIGSRAGGERWESVTDQRLWEEVEATRQPWKPRSMKCWAHCIFSAPIFWITYKFWNVGGGQHWLSWSRLVGRLGCAVLTCSGWIPEAMRSLIMRTWARFFGSAGRRRGPGRVSSMYWITANCAGMKHFNKYSRITQKLKFRKTNVYGLTDWDRVMPSISTAGTCCIGFNVLYCSVS